MPPAAQPSDAARKPLRSVPRYFLSGLYQQLSQKDVFLWAQAIAFKVLVTILPVILLSTGIMGQILRGENAFEQVARYLRTFLPYQSTQFIEFIEKLQGASGTLTIIGIAGLLFSAVTLFTTLRVVVGNVFQEEWHAQRTILGGYLFDVRMAVQVGLLFLVSFAISVTVQSFNAAGFAWLERLGFDYLWLREGWRGTFNLLGLLIPLGLTVLMFFQLYFFVPKPHPPKRSAFLGAFVAALLFEGMKFGFTFYATKVGRFDRYAQGGEGGIAALGNVFGIVLAFVFWVYFSGLVLCIGAVIALLHEKHYRTLRLRAASSKQAVRKKSERPTRPAPPAAPPATPAEAADETTDEATAEAEATDAAEATAEAEAASPAPKSSPPSAQEPSS